MSYDRPTVFVFAQHGCPACEQYIPRLQRVRTNFRDIDVRIYDLASDEHAVKFAEQLGGVRSIPMTVVMKGGGLQRHVGALPDAQIRSILASCR